MAKKRTTSEVKPNDLRRELCLMGIKRAFMLLTKKGHLTPLGKKQFHSVRINRKLLLELGKLELLANLRKQDIRFVLSTKFSFDDIEEEEVLKLLLQNWKEKSSWKKLMSSLGSLFANGNVELQSVLALIANSSL